MCELLHTSPVVQKMMGSQCPATARGWSLFSALFAAALMQPNNDLSDHEHGQQERDDHAQAEQAPSHMAYGRPATVRGSTLDSKMPIARQ